LPIQHRISQSIVEYEQEQEEENYLHDSNFRKSIGTKVEETNKTVAKFLEASPLLKSRSHSDLNRSNESDKSVLEPAMEMFLQQRQEIQQKIEHKPQTLLELAEQ